MTAQYSGVSQDIYAGRNDCESPVYFGATVSSIDVKAEISACFYNGSVNLTMCLHALPEIV